MKVTVTLILTLLLCSVSIAQEVLFFDDFESGMDDAWVNPDGGWVVEDGHLTVTSACGFQQCNPNLYAGGSEQANYLISFDFMVTEAFTSHGSFVACYFAVDNPVEPVEGVTSGYAIGCGWSSDGSPENANCQIQRIDNSSEATNVTITGEQFWIEPNVLYHMIIGRSGAEIVIKKWADGEPEPTWLLSVTDETYQSGYWMPTFWNQVGWIDNFTVTGYGVVSNEDMTWGGVKSLFR